MKRLYVNVTEIVKYGENGAKNTVNYLETRVAKTEKGAKTLFNKVRSLKKYQGDRFSAALNSYKAEAGR